MQVRAKKRASPKGEIKTRGAQGFSFPSPVRGLILNESIAITQPGGALLLDNWICTTTGIKARGGTALHVPLPAPVTALFPYQSGGANRFFGATATTIYDITSPGAGTPPTVVTGQTSGAYSTTQFGTAGGDFLYAVNGADKALLFDGAAWTQIDGLSTPAITGVATTVFSQVWSYANRLFFLEKGTLNAWYLPVDSIGGAANVFSLAGVFKLGGSLLFGATWSLDAGDGLDDKCVFVSDRGEVAIYEGTNPGSAADWRKVGVYNITVPLGHKGKMQAGGDLLIATQSGLVPISQAIQRDTAALEMSAVSAKITPLWQAKAFELSSGGWEIEKWAAENVMIVSQPGDKESTCLIANLQTGAWSRFTGLNVQHLGAFGDQMFFGGTDGNIYQFEAGGTDNGKNYTAAYLGQHESLGIPGVQKTTNLMRAVFRTNMRLVPLVAAATDYDRNICPAPTAGEEPAGAGIWGLTKWGAGTWGSGTTVTTQAAWSSIGRTGYAIAPEVQLTFGNVSKPDVELISVDATFHVGALVT